MDEYYQFIQKVADIQASDKNEWVQITDAPGGGMNVRISKINKEGKIEDELMNKTYDPASHQRDSYLPTEWEGQCM